MFRFPKATRSNGRGEYGAWLRQEEDRMIVPLSLLLILMLLYGLFIRYGTPAAFVGHPVRRSRRNSRSTSPA